MRHGFHFSFSSRKNCCSRSSLYHVAFFYDFWVEKSNEKRCLRLQQLWKISSSACRSRTNRLIRVQFLFFKLERDYVPNGKWWELAISWSKNQKINQVYMCEILLPNFGSKTKLARVQKDPDLIEMGPEWFGILTQVKSGPRPNETLK